MWYITFLILWYVAFYFLFLLKIHNTLKIIGLFLFGILLFILKDIFPNGAGAHLHIFDFPIGVAIGYLSSIRKISLPKYLFYTISLVCLSIAIITLSKMSQSGLYYILSDIAFAVGIFCFFIAFAFKSKMLIFLGGISYQLYLFEGVFLFQYSLFDRSNLIISFLTYFLVIVILSVFLKKLLKIQINKRPPMEFKM